MTLTISSLAPISLVITSLVLYQSYVQIERSSINHATDGARIAQRSISRHLELLSLTPDGLQWRYRHSRRQTMEEPG